MPRVDVLAVMRDCVTVARCHIESHQRHSFEVEYALAAVADLMNALYVAVDALEKSDPGHPLLPNMKEALGNAGASYE